MDILANNYGYTPEEMHEVLKLLHNTKTINWKGKEKKIPQSTATLTIQQFEEYCERIRVWATGEGIKIPLPNEIEINL